jgi:hypothetical protein
MLTFAEQMAEFKRAAQLEALEDLRVAIISKMEENDNDQHMGSHNMFDGIMEGLTRALAIIVRKQIVLIEQEASA